MKLRGTNFLMYKALFLSPMVPTYDVCKTTDFLHDALGFDIRNLDSGYAICQRDQMTLHLLPAGKDIGEMELYLEVDDVDAVWEVLKSHVEGIRHKPPSDREYGMREIHVDIPATKALMFIGQSIG